MKKYSFLAFGLLSVLTLGSCQKADDSKTITVAASPTPHAIILEKAIKPIVEKDGYTLVIKELTDYIIPNTSVEDGSAFANYFQHNPYLTNFNAERNTHLTAICGVHYEPFGIFAGKSTDLANIPDEAQIGVPNDPTNEGRALALLEAEGIITLKEGVGLTATKGDILENPHNVQIVELEAQSVARAVKLKDLDFGVVNGNYAMQNELGSAIAYESTESDAANYYTNVVVVKEGNEDDPRSLELLKAFQDESTKDFINDYFDGTAIYNYLDPDQLSSAE